MHHQKARWFVILGLSLLLARGAPVSAQQAAGGEDWREQYAYSVGVQAYVYEMPILYLTRLRHKWATDASSFPYAAMNHFYHFRKIADASYKDGGSPNNDTLYSWGFFDLSKEPVILAHPDMGERYFTFELADMYASNFGYVGKRTTGSKAGAFLIAGPNWKGEKPADVREVIVSRTPYAVVFGRTFVEGPSDVPAVNRLQDQYRVVPLSLWGKDGVKLPENRDVWAPYDAKSDRGRAVCSIGGIICNDADEALYFVAFTDVDGKIFDGSNRYILRFEKGGMPQVNEFWSLTMYDPAHNLVDNPINRYAIRDRMPLKQEPAALRLSTCSRLRLGPIKNPIGCQHPSRASSPYLCAPMVQAKQPWKAIGGLQPSRGRTEWWRRLPNVRYWPKADMS
jgi:hypothetical protein